MFYGVLRTEYENFIIFLSVFFTPIRYITTAMRWLNLSDCQRSFNRSTTNVEYFFIFRVSSGKGFFWNGSARIRQPRSRNICQNLKISLFVLLTTPCNITCSIPGTNLCERVRLTWIIIDTMHKNNTFPGIMALPCDARPIYSGMLP